MPPSIATSVPVMKASMSLSRNATAAPTSRGVPQRPMRWNFMKSVRARATVLPEGQVAFSLFNFCSYSDLGLGGYTGPGAMPADRPHQVRLRLTDLPEEAEEELLARVAFYRPRRSFSYYCCDALPARARRPHIPSKGESCARPA